MSYFDAAVVGRGPAGLAAACLIARDSGRVGLIGRRYDAAADPRTIALMAPSIRLLETIGLWPGGLRERTSPLRRLRLVDDTRSMLRAPEIVFAANELGLEAFGWNIPLAILMRALEEEAQSLGVTFIDDEVTGASPSSTDVALRTGNGEVVTARVVLAADGRHSILREAAGIKANQWSYDQTAIATSFAHSATHQDISTEYHRAAGPCTTVPMPGGRSALVWMERPARAAELMAMTGTELAREIQVATHGELGCISGVGPRRAFPMQGLIAREFARNRIMLVGEAGHVVPPIGAQGLNMSFRDAGHAAEIIAHADDPGSTAHMKEYDAARRLDVQPRQQAIDLMNRSLLSGFLPMEGARAVALTLIANFGPLRRLVMRQGVGLSRHLPEAMEEHPMG